MFVHFSIDSTTIDLEKPDFAGYFISFKGVYKDWVCKPPQYICTQRHHFVEVKEND